MDPESPVISEHLSQGQRAVHIKDGHVVLATGKHAAPIADISKIPMTGVATAQEQLENYLAAIGAAWALDINPNVIRTGVKTFEAAAAAATTGN
jgi:cyanophycin synthetase